MLVVAPVYNEVDVLERVLCNIRQYHQGDILVVDDGSTDGSSEILAKIDWITLLTHKKNMGYGQSLIDAFSYSIDKKYDQVITIDCDEQHEPRLIPEMFSCCGDHDIVSGSRYLKETVENDHAPEDRRSINRTITGVINKITNFNITDSFCGFKQYKVEALSKLELDEPGYAMPLQFWIQAKQFGFNVAEMPVARIYKDVNRSFGGDLDNPQLRFDYYNRVIERELARWSMSLSSELIQTI